MRTFTVFLLVFFLGACAKNAIVDLENAPVSAGNINSRRVAFADIILLDTQSGTFNYLGNLLQLQTKPTPEYDGLNIVKVNQGTYSTGASAEIDITLIGDINGLRPQITAGITNSLSFEMTKSEQTRFMFPPKDVLNSGEAAAFRTSQADYAGDRFKFLFINEVFSGEQISYKVNDGEAVGNFTLDVAGQKIDVTFKNGSEVSCSGQDNACVVMAQIWKLRRNSSGKTGFEFVLDTERDARVVFQAGLKTGAN